MHLREIRVKVEKGRSEATVSPHRLYIALFLWALAFRSGPRELNRKKRWLVWSCGRRRTDTLQAQNRCLRGSTRRDTSAVWEAQELEEGPRVEMEEANFNLYSSAQSSNGWVRRMDGKKAFIIYSVHAFRREASTDTALLPCSAVPWFDSPCRLLIKTPQKRSQRPKSPDCLLELMTWFLTSSTDYVVWPTALSFFSNKRRCHLTWLNKYCRLH